MRAERQIIERIRRAVPGQKTRGWLPLGLGDDAALLSPAGGGNHEMALSTDWSLESVHFDPQIHAPDVIGYKALARATSDLAAMGANPRFFLLSLALPKARTGAWLDRFAAGLGRAASEFGMELIGGDTSADSRVAINITVGGSTRRGHALTRSGARVGDQIFVSGTLGAAQLGLELLQRAAKRSAKLPANERYAIERHLRPKIRLELSQWLAGESPRGSKIASAAIDISDGFSTDLTHLCESSGVGARIYARDIPLVAFSLTPRPRNSRSGTSALARALHGGEDYELLFTIPARLARKLQLRLSHHGGLKLSRIGEIVPARRARGPIELIAYSGAVHSVAARGWDSFQK